MCEKESCDGCKHEGQSLEQYPCEWCARNPELGDLIDEYELQKKEKEENDLICPDCGGKLIVIDSTRKDCEDCENIYQWDISDEFE